MSLRQKSGPTQRKPSKWQLFPPTATNASVAGTTCSTWPPSAHGPTSADAAPAPSNRWATNKRWEYKEIPALVPAEFFPFCHPEWSARKERKIEGPASQRDAI